MLDSRWWQKRKLAPWGSRRAEPSQQPELSNCGLPREKNKYRPCLSHCSFEFLLLSAKFNHANTLLSLLSSQGKYLIKILLSSTPPYCPHFASRLV